MISQIMEGVKSCKVHEAIQEYPEQMRPLFCIDAVQHDLDEDQFLDLFHVDYSDQQQNKLKEINTFKVFSDFVSMVFHGGLYKLD